MNLHDTPNNQNGVGPLPEMETFPDAEAVSEKEHDHFFLCAFITLAEMPPRFGETEARSMRDATEMQPRWKRDGSEIWRDASLCKFSQISKNLSKSQESLLSGGFRTRSTIPLLRINTTFASFNRFNPFN